ncbi:hypothetical protein [Arenimonas composti]|uniref:Uncharacterized protein n=1 Tax=Arenimonas composti TR7-09 = DSM 18010 TaxID=1121013 RepID=A0A091BWW7_9GAMM|nr:hypothetical protein [Arenimonas composti]KFN48835.1 hypothetical protein P873_13565 [Arenimonas composti TR7-09 = DSM 18010]
MSQSALRRAGHVVGRLFFLVLLVASAAAQAQSPPVLTVSLDPLIYVEDSAAVPLDATATYAVGGAPIMAVSIHLPDGTGDDVFCLLPAHGPATSSPASTRPAGC